MPKLRVPHRSPAKQGDDDVILSGLTRDDVAKRLGVSISTVRRFEGTRLHPVIDATSTNVGVAVVAVASRTHLYAVESGIPSLAATTVTASPRFVTARISSLRS